MKKVLFHELIESVRQAGKIQRGGLKPSRRYYFDLNIKMLREKIGVTQQTFATMIGVSSRTLQNWEQGRRRPQGPALALLRIFKNDPKRAYKALHHG